MPHWFAMCGASLCFDALSTASRLSPAALTAMAPPSCRPHWPQELGLCTRCLEHAPDGGQPLTWNRHWMHPLAAVCIVHGTWLTPVATHTLARIHHATDFASLGHRVGTPGDEPAGAEDALWLQELCCSRKNKRPPWGYTPRRVIIRIVAMMARAVLSAGAAETDVLASRLEHSQWNIKDFTLETEAGHRTRLWLPTRLRHRQRVLGTVAHLLRRTPEARSGLQPWSASMVKQLTWASTDDWPAAALEWICPEAAELVQRQDKLRKEFGVSPRYFRACSALVASVP